MQLVVVLKIKRLMQFTTYLFVSSREVFENLSYSRESVLRYSNLSKNLYPIKMLVRLSTIIHYHPNSMD